MNARSKVLVPPLVLVLLGAACGRPATSAPGGPTTPPAAPAMEDTAWTLTGILHQVGSYPHMEMVISGSTARFGKGEYYVVGPLQREIAALEPGRISVRGTLLRKELALAGSSGRMRLRLEVEVTAYAR